MNTELKTKIITGVMDIPISLIKPDPDQPRKKFTPEQIEALGECILAEGLLQPITVRRDPHAPGEYVIIAGERRWRAHCLKNIQTIHCIVSGHHHDAARRFRAQFMENANRQNMTMREDANAVAKMTELGDSDAVIAKTIGESLNRVGHLRTMSEMPESFWNVIEKGGLAPWLVFKATGAVEKKHLEMILVRCVNKDNRQQSAIIDSYVDEKNQADFELACEQAGVSKAKNDVVKSLAGQILMIAAAIEKLSQPQRLVLSRKLGKEVAELVGTKSNKRAAQFLSKTFNQIDVMIDA
jgi:ParB/RepB/Spo0J family partition protein